MSETGNPGTNLTKYEVVDKDITHYTRAPILSFLYELPVKVDQFEPSSVSHSLLRNINSFTV